MRCWSDPAGVRRLFRDRDSRWHRTAGPDVPADGL